MDAQIDRFPVSELTDRYKIKRTALYERFKALKIKPNKQGHKSYVDRDQLQQLDDLQVHLQRGGGISDFLCEPKPPSREQGKQTQPLKIINHSGESVSLVEVLTSQLVRVIESKLSPPVEPLAHLEALEKAYEKGWLLSTSELAQLLKLSAKTIRSYGNSFCQAGFTFTRAGTRARQETAWKVSKTC